MKLIFIGREEIDGKRVVILEYSGFDDEQIESILKKSGLRYDKKGRLIIVSGKSILRISSSKASFFLLSTFSKGLV
ncbi:MAG: hypothetical protein B6U95_09515 [Thermofilum sp. ex4484_82]|nr:MAG: hypothetical protein B6U95_09515 [Thermofilum sp. ex4484_82]OYT35780.1 MAG: hypothetical protein B6U96_09525 [Archaeoglobales archaeon ex4484_92]